MWTNSSPTSNFSPQTLSFDLSSYDHIVIEYRYTTSTDYRKTIACYPNGAIYNLDFSYTNKDTVPYIAGRTVKITVDGVQFYDGLIQPCNQTARTVNNADVIPVKIIGYKC